MSVLNKAKRFDVIRVEPTDAPDGMEAGPWHRYIIGEGSAQIEGLRCGSKEEVMQHAQEFAKSLNERGRGGPGGYGNRNTKK